MRIEILHGRDPDGGCEHDIWIDGVRVENIGSSMPDVEIHIETVDAGRGYTMEDWEEHSNYVAEAGYTEEFTNAVLGLREEPPGSEFIE